MNKHNLIQLGALAQKKFNMKDNFTIVDIPSDSIHRYRVAIPAPITNPHSPYANPVNFDEVDLVEFGSQDNFEFIWCGYAPRANVLVVQDAG